MQALSLFHSVLPFNQSVRCPTNKLNPMTPPAFSVVFGQPQLGVASLPARFVTLCVLLDLRDGSQATDVAAPQAQCSCGHSFASAAPPLRLPCLCLFLLRLLALLPLRCLFLLLIMHTAVGSSTNPSTIRRADLRSLYGMNVVCVRASLFLRP